MALPGYLEDTAKDYAKQATATYKAPIETSTFTGGLDASGQRAAGPGITGINPYVAQMDPLQTDAISMAKAGVGSYAPYLTAAQGNVAAAGTAQAGLGALSGAQAYQPFMSPYQQDVIDTSLQAFDKQAAQQQQLLKDQALGKGYEGTFGGGRQGVQLAEYQSGSDLNRAALEARMRQQNFQQAQQGAQTAFGQQQQIAQGQLGLGAAQMGLSNFQRAGMGADIGALGQMGSLRQGQTQAQLTADQQMKQAQAYEPYGRLGQWGQGLTGLAGGVAGMQYNQPQPASPWQSALSSALGIGGLFGKIYG